MDWMLKFILLVYILKIAFASSDRSRCPAKIRDQRNFIKTYNEHCYLFVNNEKYWDEARDYCWKLGGEMLYVQDDKTMQFIKGVLNSRELGWDSNGVWNGASDLRSKGWEWTNGKPLSYQYWAPGEPSKTLGFLSIENCCCMRRGDGWRWHDYHCHMIGLEYNFICQFSMSNTETFTDAHSNSGGAVLGDTNNYALIGLIIAGAALLMVFCGTIFFLYRKHERQKRELEKRQQRHVVRFQNTGYATVMQDISGNPQRESVQRVRPISNIYHDPAEVTRVYEEPIKTSQPAATHSEDNLTGVAGGNITESSPILYTGVGSSADNLTAGVLSPISTARSEPLSIASNADSEYVEMSGNNSLQSNSSINQVHTAPVNVTSSLDDLKSWKGGATGSVNDMTESNVYVTCNSDEKLNNLHTEKKPGSTEIHIYSNKLDELDSSLRPLPPLPHDVSGDNSIEVKKVSQ